MLPFVIAVGAFGLACGLTLWIRRKAAEHRLIDVPNSRSMHATATPRGGGVAISTAAIAAIVVLGLANWLAWPAVWSLCGGGGLVALIGFIDDRSGLPPKWRLLGHFLAAIAAIAVVGGAPPITVHGIALSSPLLGFAFAAAYVVWLLNLTNFMDGIDGLAATEGATVCLAAAALCEVAAPGELAWAAPVVVASAILGFLVWNWPPASIFMGDAGSGFLGMTFGLLSLQAGWVSDRLFWSWIILLGVFVVDATMTLIIRVARGEKAYLAHRSHAYQQAALRMGRHRPVTLAVAAINLFWLLPVAFLVARGSLGGFVGVLVAYAPLAAVALKLRAGFPFVPGQVKSSGRLRAPHHR